MLEVSNYSPPSLTNNPGICHIKIFFTPHGLSFRLAGFSNMLNPRKVGIKLLDCFENFGLGVFALVLVIDFNAQTFTCASDICHLGFGVEILVRNVRYDSIELSQRKQSSSTGKSW